MTRASRNAQYIKYSINIHQLTIDTKPSTNKKNVKPHIKKRPIPLSAKDLTVNSNLSALQEKQLEIQVEEKKLEGDIVEGGFGGLYPPKFVETG